MKRMKEKQQRGLALAGAAMAVVVSAPGPGAVRAYYSRATTEGDSGISRSSSSVSRRTTSADTEVIYSEQTILRLDALLEKVMESRTVRRKGAVTALRRRSDVAAGSQTDAGGGVTVFSRAMDSVTQRPMSALVLVAKPGVDAKQALADFEAGKLSEKGLASKLWWHGFTTPSGSFTVHGVPRGVKLSGVVIGDGYRLATFSVNVRDHDPLRMPLYPVLLKR